MYPALQREEDGWHARWCALGTDNPWVDAYVREAAVTPLSADAEDQRHETLHDAWLMALRSETGLVRWNDAECAAFAAELAEWSGAAEEDVAARTAVNFRFSAEGAGDFRIRTAMPKGRRGLRALGQAAFVFGPIRAMHRERAADGAGGGGLVVELSRAEAESFLRSGARELNEAGYSVSGCDIKASVNASVELGSDRVELGSDRVGLGSDRVGLGSDRVELGSDRVGLESRAHSSTLKDSTSTLSDPNLTLSDSKPTLKDPKIATRLIVRVAGEVVDAEEVRFLLEQKSTLVFFRDRWIDVDRNVLKEALRALERSESRTLSTTAALGFAMGVGAVGRMEVEEARSHGWLRGLVNELRQRIAAANGNGSTAPRSPEAARQSPLTAVLRPYQARGVSWIRFLTNHGFGALLADDMGLGKTVQTIAWIASLRGNHQPPTTNHPFLIVSPLTLVSNWRHEFAKFAPGMKVYVHQGDNRALETGFRREADAADVVLTSYSLLVRDYQIIRRVEWAGLVLDEAQAVKNPDTQVARAVRALGAPKRLALTGTPVENTVSDVWSLEEFLNPGFLGDRKSFVERFVKPIALDERSAAAKRLRHALEPFVLRRLKSDPEIAAELGEKREIKEYCVLSPGQRREYEAALADYRASERRRGDVFALITRLKLICDGAGKVERLVELVGSVLAAGESVLVFTQYAKVGSELKKVLDAKFAGDTPFLHGSLPARQREDEIARFNDAGPSAFVLSLKAGGYGLNLVKATHVVHFDRWWNPAVEAQATDRAHRIGQARTVFVHAFISEGTLEEHVDEILERKSRVAGTLVASGEGFLMQLQPDELEAALALT